jgi:dTDP-4-dehydrorhamnose 3,5-epimerase
MKFTTHAVLTDVIVIAPDIHQDKRGHFLETFRAQQYAENGLPHRFVQDNLSFSSQGVLRGLHYQLGKPQGKLLWVVHGEVFDVAVDIRRHSPSFGKWAGITLSSQDYSQIFIPEGFAHGFYVVSQTATLLYKCTDYYAPEEERGIRWDDPALGIDWPATNPILSEKDSTYPSLKDLPDSEFPMFGDPSSTP